MTASRVRRWDELSPWQRRSIVAGSALQLGLLGAALNDLRRRPQREVNGDKRLWVLASFVNFVGPLAYFGFGRRR